jgi:exodeoxyribonuclease VIII
MLTPTHELSNEDYHRHPAISRSAIASIQRSPRHFWAHQYGGLPRSGPTPAMLFGTAVHMAVLEPELFLQTYVEAPKLSKLSKAYKEAVAEIEAAGQIALPAAEIEQITGMVAAIREHETASKALYGPGISEATYITNDPTTDLAIKCRADRVTNSGWLVDLKTTTDASENAFTKTCVNFGYHVQAAYYMHTVEAATGIRPKGFLFVAVEKAPPYGVQVFRCSDIVLEVGMDIASNALLDIKQNLVTYGVDQPWPSYSQKTCTLELPAWALR